MSRVQLALNVSDLEAAIDFYGKLFDAEPAKVRPGYANFAIADPPLKLVLIENQEGGGTLNHLGVEVADTETVAAATHRLAATGLATRTEESTACCYAVQDKFCVFFNDSATWEIYTVLGDAPTMKSSDVATDACCAPAAATAKNEVPAGA
ncbi:MAG: VOC family protein [Candidatus Dormibacteraeota bacterium]|nr:VOC family protein [Candidatus Dormibacteraeota bacterium]